MIKHVHISYILGIAIVRSWNRHKSKRGQVWNNFVLPDPRSNLQTSMPGLPDEYLEEESESGRGEEDVVPRTLLIVLKNLRVFGHFDNKIFVDLMKNIDYLNLKAHDSLFKVSTYLYIAPNQDLP